VAGRGQRNPPHQEVRFARGVGGVRLAWAAHGSGPTLVLSSCWLSHLQYDWHSPVWRHFLNALGDLATVVRYDERGFGLSDWAVDDFSLPSRLADLEVIADAGAPGRFALMGMSAGAPVAVAYAAAHPERVSRLVLYAPIGSGCFAASDDVEAEEALLGVIRAGWARREGMFRRLFTSVLIPDASDEQMLWVDDLQRMATSPGNAVASRVARRQIDVLPLLERVQAPTLVLHARDDRAAPFRWGTEMSARIPEARLVPLDSHNHILLADEPAWQVFLSEVTAFLEPERTPTTAAPSLALSARESEIVRLAATGLDNGSIAATLHLSPRTVERHLQNVYLKAGVSGRTARTAVVARYLATI
jgi:pimeloyl-ACP methyl ester carboxylesterase/DNA-binding CsgD family transcriptional regulator